MPVHTHLLLVMSQHFQTVFLVSLPLDAIRGKAIDSGTRDGMTSFLIVFSIGDIRWVCFSDVHFLHILYEIDLQILYPFHYTNPKILTNRD